jgi:hypothetical protein
MFDEMLNDIVNSPWMKRQIKMAEQEKVYKKQKHEGIDGKYEQLKDVGAYKKWTIHDSQGGYIEGVWCTKTKQVIRFDNEKYFISLS